MNVKALAVSLGLLLTPMALALPAGAAVDIQPIVSPKGIEAWLVEEHTVPVIAVSFAFEGAGSGRIEGKRLVSGGSSGSARSPEGARVGRLSWSRPIARSSP